MTSTQPFAATLSAIAVAAMAGSPAYAGAKPGSADVEVMTCPVPNASTAITDGDPQGWTKPGLYSSQAMFGAIVQGEPAKHLLSALAGSQEEIDQTVNVAKSAPTSGLVQSGAAGALISKVPFGGQMQGGLGGRKKTMTAGLRLVTPAHDQTLLSGSGQSQKSTIKILSSSDWGAASQGQPGQYGTFADGKMATSAFMAAYNMLASQAISPGAAINGTTAAAPAANYTVAVDPKMLACATAGARSVRPLRAATTLIPTGRKDGMFGELADTCGTRGWVSVEDLR
ncbi:hypothetical protein [Blastomonas sp. AAP53]|uniref:hypothetical protein n=1 Tax=Blastomonas sp. AAP53 TaxID=1248760 RepID=UPI0002E236A8|nr:hypothetical protein [Blastomonas sp. AAP53]